MPEREHAVLVITRDASLRAGLTLNFEVDGYRVVAVSNGPSPVSPGVASGVAVALVDFDAPDAETWIGVLLSWRVAVVVLCGSEHRSALRRQWALEDSRVIVKPFKLETLLSIVRQVLA